MRTQSTSEGEWLHVKQLHPSLHAHMHTAVRATPSLLRNTSHLPLSLYLSPSSIHSLRIGALFPRAPLCVFFSSPPPFLPIEHREVESIVIFQSVQTPRPASAYISQCIELHKPPWRYPSPFKLQARVLHARQQYRNVTAAHPMEPGATRRDCR